MLFPHTYPSALRAGGLPGTDKNASQLLQVGVKVFSNCQRYSVHCCLGSKLNELAWPENYCSSKKKCIHCCYDQTGELCWMYKHCELWYQLLL